MYSFQKYYCSTKLKTLSIGVLFLLSLFGFSVSVSAQNGSTTADENEMLNKQIQKGLKQPNTPVDKVKMKEQEISLQKMAIENQMNEINSLKNQNTKSEKEIKSSNQLLDEKNKSLQKSFAELNQKQIELANAELLARKASDSLLLVQKTSQIEQAKLKTTSQRNYLLLAILSLIFVFALFLIRSLRKTNKVNQQLSSTLYELNNTQQHLIVKEKLASLGQLTSGIAHEIQNPLNFVNNFSEVSVELISEMNETIGNVENLAPQQLQELKENLETLSQNQTIIAQHGKRAEAIVKNMLQLSTESKSELQLCKLCKVVEDYVHLSWNNIKSKQAIPNIELTVVAEPDLPEIKIYKQDIGRVMMALIDNAVYAVLEKIKTKPANYTPEIKVTISSHHQEIKVSVADNGIGMNDAVKEKLFTPFFTTKPTGQGTGLSLSISHEIIVQQHGGKMQVVSHPGDFSIFSFILPY